MGPHADPPVLTRPVITLAERADRDTYTIQPGDTFASIATKLYGSDRYLSLIAQANPLVDPTRLQVGQVIRLPEPSHLRGATAPASDDGQTVVYTVRSGDTLSSIARQYYGSPEKWRTIYNANRKLIGPNPNGLRAGAQLTVPPAP